MIAYDGLLVQVVACPDHGAQILIAVGDDGEYPAAGHLVCPTDGIDGLVDELRRAQAAAAPLHIAHGGGAGKRGAPGRRHQATRRRRR